VFRGIRELGPNSVARAFRDSCERPEINHGEHREHREKNLPVADTDFSVRSPHFPGFL